MSKDKNNNPEETETLEDQDQVQENEPQTEEGTIETSESEEQTEEEALDPMSKLELERDELKDKYLRLMAEFDNFRKRTVRERLENMDMAAKGTLVKLLPILDDFDRAKANAEDENSEEPFSEGVLMIYNRLHATLKSMGLEEMVSNGETFDPELHEAITHIPAPSDELKGKIVDTTEKGYTLKDKIIRHAKVVVGK